MMITSTWSWTGQSSTPVINHLREIYEATNKLREAQSDHAKSLTVSESPIGRDQSELR